MGHDGLAVALHRIILAQRIAFPVFRHEQPPQIGMPAEADAEKIKNFALEVICPGPDRSD